jgi:hypothetical protein
MQHFIYMLNHYAFKFLSFSHIDFFVSLSRNDNIKQLDTKVNKPLSKEIA